MDNRDAVATATRYAILIGINAYPEGYNPLKSCVQDVQDMADYLGRVSGSCHVHKLTATVREDSESCSPAEESVRWPTYNNVTSAFEKVTFLSKAGDFVYIHYSGHGTRGQPCSEFSNKSTGDLALVLLDGEKGNEIRYLWGSTLAFYFKAMVDKGLVVTLVLDCCFSASVYRWDDPGTRCLPYDFDIDSKYDLDPEKRLRDEADLQRNRDVSMLPNWLINPDGYVILVACGPHEVAKGLIYDGRRLGALSYFLLRVLTECGGLEKKVKDIHYNLCARFRESSLQQHPVIYGKGDQGFFGPVNSDIGIIPITVVERHGNFQLQAGQAHGIYIGDQFALYPGKSNLSSNGGLIAEITQARPFTSDLKLLDATPICAHTGWIAKALTRGSLRRIPIRLSSTLPHQAEWQEALKKRLLCVHLDRDKYPFSFSVTLNRGMEYEILDASDHNVFNLPAMPQDQMDINYVCDIIEHLAKFKMVRDLVNNAPADPFRESFSAQIISRSGQKFYPESLVTVEHDKVQIELVVENKGNNVLYTYVYDMGPCWQIENILKGSYEAIPPRNHHQGFTGMFRKKLKTVVPPELRNKGQQECEDLIKVFVTSQPTSFDLLELPKIGGLAKTTRDIRTGSKGRDSSEQWATLVFPVRTFLKESH